MSTAWSGASTEVPVSVVIPCHGAQSTLARAVASVAQQSARALELIVVDDASGEDTRRVLHELQQRYGARWLRILEFGRNRGPASARNAGWEEARGDCVAFLDADDSWHPRKLEIQHAMMLRHPEISLLAHRHTFATAADLQGEAEARLTVVSGRELLWRNRFVTPSVMVRRHVTMRFREGQRHMEDHLLWLQLAHAGHRIAVIELPLATLYKPAFGESGLSAQMLAMERAELGNYLRLRRDGAIGPLMLALLWAWSLAKFLRRLGVVAGRGLSRRRASG